MRTNRNGLVQREPPPAALIPSGDHAARLVDVFPFANAHGERVGFAYEVQSGPDAGTVLVQSAACSSSPSSKLAAILRDLLGREPTEGELGRREEKSLIGLACTITTRDEFNRAGKRYSAVVGARRYT